MGANISIRALAGIRFLAPFSTEGQVSRLPGQREFCNQADGFDTRQRGHMLLQLLEKDRLLLRLGIRIGQVNPDRQ